MMNQLIIVFSILLLVSLAQSDDKPLRITDREQRIAEKVGRARAALAKEPARNPAQAPDNSIPYPEANIPLNAESNQQAQDQITNAKLNEKDQTNTVEPQRSSDDGSHLTLVPYYSPKTPKLELKTKQGEYFYKTKPSPQKESAGIRLSPYTPSELKGTVNGVTFNNIYNQSKPFLVAFDYEYQFFQSFGKLGIKPSIGFFTAQGQGRFKNDITVQSDEIFNLYVFPLSAALCYRMHYWDRQPIVPYGEAGGTYYGMLESRSDKKGMDGIKYGGAPAWFWAAGGALQLDFLDKANVWQLDSEYGINHLYLVGGVRQIFGLDSTFDFSALIYEGGILFEF